MRRNIKTRVYYQKIIKIVKTRKESFNEVCDTITIQNECKVKGMKEILSVEKRVQVGEISKSTSGN